MSMSDWDVGNHSLQAGLPSAASGWLCLKVLRTLGFMIFQYIRYHRILRYGDLFRLSLYDS